ncbi:MAG TPA: PAS domain-containing protein [Cytophagaceae bacterium]
MGYKIIKKKDLENLIKENEALKKQLTKASEFVSLISSGDFKTVLEINDASTDIGSLNANLLSLKEQLIKIDKEEKQRSWSAQGIAHFIDILRGNHQDNQKFYDTVISNLVKYLEANQGGLFIINDPDEKNVYLELKACYAYDRKKFMEKIIQPGEGLIGQCYLEKEKILLTEIPQNYVTITSGLGQATPTNLLLVPLKNNEDVVGIIELASFKPFETYHIEFIEKLSESIAVSIKNMRTQEKTNRLLIISQESTEELRAQEEELRQNMEEMAAIQEDLQRSLTQMKDLKEQLEIREKVFGLTTILSESDKFGTITYVNDKLCQVAKYSREELINKGHNIFRHPDMPKELFKLLWDTIKKGQVFQGIVKNKAKDGTHYWVDATIVPVLDDNGDIVKYIGARYHITNDRLAEDLYEKQAAKLGLPGLKSSEIEV